MKPTPIQTFTTAVVASGNLFVREATQLFRPFGLTVPQFDALEMLSHAPGGLRQNELASSLIVDPSTATYLLDILEKRNWVERTDDPTDRRALRILITSEGKAIHRKASKPYRAALAHLETLLPEANIIAATQLLQSLPAAAIAAREAAESAHP